MHYEQELEDIHRHRKEILNTAKTQAAQILANTNAKIEQTIREIKEANAEKEKTKTIRQSLEEFKKNVSVIEEEQNPKSGENQKKRKSRVKQSNRASRKNQKDPQIPSPPTLSPGDYVRLKGQQAIGTILELTEKQAVIAFNTIKSTVKREQLEKVNQTQIKKEPAKSAFISSQTTDSMYEKKLHFKLDIDVRGMRGDEALQAVTYFLDDAIQINAGRVRILHGTGNGILRQLIRNYLHAIPGVKHFGDEHVQFGGTGITVVDLE